MASSLKGLDMPRIFQASVRCKKYKLWKPWIVWSAAFYYKGAAQVVEYRRTSDAAELATMAMAMRSADC